MNDISIKEFIEKFDRFPVYKESVKINLGNLYGFMEITESFRDELKEAFIKKIIAIQSGIDESDPITKFAVMVLADSTIYC